MNNFATFYAQSVKNKTRKIKRGKYKGQSGSINNRDIKLPGPAYHPQPGKSDAPSASTFKSVG